MKAIEIQTKLNNLLARTRNKMTAKQLAKAKLLFDNMNEARIAEGLNFIELPNLQKAFNQHL